MKKLLATLLAVSMLFGMTACASKETAPAETEKPAATEKEETAPAETEETEEPEEAVAARDLKIGMVLIGDENYYYDQAHLEGIHDAMDELGLAPEQLVCKYNIDGDATLDSLYTLAEDGCNLLITDSYSHHTYTQQAAAEYPDVKFIGISGDTAAAAGLPNYSNMFINTFESRYVSGVVAGMKLKELMDSGEVTDPHIGYVGAYPFAEVIGGYTAFLLGIQSIVPEAHMDVQYTSSWSDLLLESEAAKALFARGCVIIGQHGSTTGPSSAAQEALESGKTAYVVGYGIDVLNVAPDAALTSAKNVWKALYVEMLGLAMAGEDLPVDLALGYKDGAQMITELNATCPEGTQEAVDAAWAGIADGSLQVYDTSTFTVGGEEVTSAMALDTDGDWVPDSGEAIVDGAFQESVHRSAPYFALMIDGITELNND